MPRGKAQKQLWSVQESYQRYGFPDENAMTYALRRGDFPGERVGGKWKVPVPAIDKAIEEKARRKILKETESDE